MKRRNFISFGLYFLGGGFLTGRAADEYCPPSVEKFMEALDGIQLQFASRDILLKIMGRNLSDADRSQLVKELIRHNRRIYFPASGRKFGLPGFYRVEGD